MDPTNTQPAGDGEEPVSELIDLGEASVETRGTMWGVHFDGGFGARPP